MQTLDHSTRAVCLCLSLLAGLLPSLNAARAETPTGPRVSEVIITGNHSVPSEWIKKLIKTQPGSEFRPATLHDDVRDLYRTRLFNNVWAGFQRTPDDRLIVTFEFVEPVQEIVYDGAKHVKSDDLETITGLHKGMTLDPFANQRAVEAILDHYHSLLRLWASVELVEGNSADDHRVAFKITEGPMARVSSIEFTGNVSVSTGRLQAVFGERHPFLGCTSIPFRPQVVSCLDCEKLETFYKALGFRDVRITRELKANNADGHTVDLIFRVAEGKRYPETATAPYYVPGEVDVHYEIEEPPTGSNAGSSPPSNSGASAIFSFWIGGYH